MSNISLSERFAFGDSATEQEEGNVVFPFVTASNATTGKGLLPEAAATFHSTPFCLLLTDSIGKSVASF